MTLIVTDAQLTCYRGIVACVVRTVFLQTSVPGDDIGYGIRISQLLAIEALITVCLGTLMGSKQLILQWFPSLHATTDRILSPVQLHSGCIGERSSLQCINLNEEDIKAFRLESILYCLAIIGSPWSQMQKPPKHTVGVAKQYRDRTCDTPECLRQSRVPVSTPVRPQLARIKTYKRENPRQPLR